ncbi:unnamed protein product [Phytophthora lilii]|uniref:Unnamed protein product n=1 Tax=Phytophthora lilii TaxID=2077276 RepID=A0A9W6T9M7_9STRA|nr:unnamed protein product [Phytophthora lilii]
MGKLMLPAVIMLLSTVEIHGQVRSDSFLRRPRSSSSSGAGSLAIILPNWTTVDAGDTAPDAAVTRPDHSDSASSRHGPSIDEAIHILSLPRGDGASSSSVTSTFEPVTVSVASIKAEPTLSSPQLNSISSSGDAGSATHYHDNSAANSPLSHDTSFTEEFHSNSLLNDVKPTATGVSNSEQGTTASAVTYVFSSSPQTSPSLSLSRNNARPSTNVQESVDIFQDNDNDAAATVEPTEEREAIKSAAIELSTSAEQVDGDSLETSVSTSATTSTRSAAPPSDKQAASSTNPTPGTSEPNDNTDGDTTADVETSDSAFNSPIFYACVVLAVSALVGGGFAFRAKRQRDIREEWRAAAETTAATPPVSNRAACAPPVSQVHVVIDDQHFAIL